MEVVKVEEIDEGDVLVTVEMTKEEMYSLIDYAFNLGLIEGLKMLKEKHLKGLEE